MNDKKLIELAAKASGVELNSDGTRWDFSKDPAELVEWNPLKDDGDALRLAVTLGKNRGLDVYLGMLAAVVDGDDSMLFVKEDHKDDPYAATRRAIVLAAAEIGEAME